MQDRTGVPQPVPPGERKYRRFKLRYPVRLMFRTRQGVSAVDTFSRDVSVGGLALQSPVSLPEHSAVSFVISLRGVTLRPIELVGEGEVVRVERSASKGFCVAVACQKPISQIEPYLSETAN